MGQDHIVLTVLISGPGVILGIVVPAIGQTIVAASGLKAQEFDKVNTIKGFESFFPVCEHLNPVLNTNCELPLAFWTQVVVLYR